MATIRKRGDKYQVQVRRQGQTPISRSFHKKADAEAWSRDMERRADTYDLPQANIQLLHTTTTADLIDRYLKKVSIRNKAYDTEYYLLNAFRRESLIAGKALSTLDVTEFNSYRDKRLRQVKPVTVHRELGLLQSLYETAMKEWGIPLKSNPIKSLKKPVVKNGRNRRLEEGELEHLMEATNLSQVNYLKPVILFALESAMRRGEIINMRWGDLDMAKRLLHIPETKNGYSRTIPLSKTAIGVIATIDKTDDYVFPITGNALRL